MDSMDNFRERFEALEQQMKVMVAHTRTIEQRLRWWRSIACGVVMLVLLSLALPSGKAADTQPRGMAERMATMEKKLAAMDFDEAANEVVISGANLRIVNGLGSTDTTNGLGNLIVGYNESRSETAVCRDVPTLPFCTETRTGSHNVVVGRFQNFSSLGGLVIGEENAISGRFASVTGGMANTASGEGASVSGGADNTASGRLAAVCGGGANTASGGEAVVSGGANNAARGDVAAISGGFGNTARGRHASVSGGQGNTASGNESSVSGGLNRTEPAPFNWAAGALFSDQ